MRRSLLIREVRNVENNGGFRLVGRQDPANVQDTLSWACLEPKPFVAVGLNFCWIQSFHILVSIQKWLFLSTESDRKLNHQHLQAVHACMLVLKLQPQVVMLSISLHCVGTGMNANSFFLLELPQ